MRVLTVLSVITLGAGIGSAAVLVPLSSGSQLGSHSWPVDWDVPAVRRMAALLPALAGPTPENPSGTAGLEPSPAETPVVHLSLPPSKEQRADHPGGQPGVPFGGQDARTFEVHTQGPVPVKAADARVSERPWSTTVVPAAETGQRVRQSSKPANDAQRLDLVRSIQSELKRVGCFEGAADGQWNSSTKRAMGQFTGRVNATLPFDEPDLILLTLVRGHRGSACGERCPAGQNLTDNGQCQPKNVLAQSDRQRMPDRTTPERLKPERVAIAPAPRPAEDAGKGAVAATASATLPINSNSNSNSNFAKVTQTGSVSALAVAAVGSAAVGGVAPAAEALARPIAPPPGRMAIGGPLPSTRAVDESQPVTESSKPDSEPDRSAPAVAPRYRQPSNATANSIPAMARRPPLPPIVVHRPQPQPHAPQYTAVQPKKQKWHPVNPFWQSY